MNYVREAFLKEGLTRAFLQLAQEKFRVEPKQLENRLSGASQEQVETWLDRILTADSIDSVFEPAKG